MDLYAYTQIDKLDKIAEENGIEVPRLRGYRLMKDEEYISDEEIREEIKRCEISVVEDLCRAVPTWSMKPVYHISDRHTDALCDYYLVKNKDNKDYRQYIGIRWDRIHGKKRKILKYAIKKKKERNLKQFITFNKYVGREDILYIHSRIGGGNWEYFNGKELEKKEWFLEKVDDCFDETYCDIYAKIKTN